MQQCSRRATVRLLVFTAICASLVLFVTRSPRRTFTQLPIGPESFNRSAECSKLCGCIFNTTSADAITCVGEKEPRLFLHNQYPCSQNLRNLADVVIGWQPNNFEESITFTNLDATALRCLPFGAIVYISAWSWNIEHFFDNLYPHMKPFVLITGETDVSAPLDHHMRYVDDPQSKIIKWFAQNARWQSLSQQARERITPIPINHNCFFTGRPLKLLTDELKSAPYAHLLRNTALVSDDPRRYAPPPDMKRSKLLLINFSPDTDPTGQRQQIINERCAESGAKSWLSFADCNVKKRGIDTVEALAQIYKRNMDYAFWLSPRGNGIDCHRTWEALTLGRVPVVLQSDIDVLFSEMPVVIVDSWDRISEPFLREKYDEIEAGRLAGRYKYHRMDLQFWRKQILSHSAYKHTADDDLKRPGRCWWPS